VVTTGAQTNLCLLKRFADDHRVSEILSNRPQLEGTTTLQTVAIGVHQLREAITRTLTEAPDCSMSRQHLRSKLNLASNSFSEFFSTAVRHLMSHGYVREVTLIGTEGKAQKCLQAVRPYERMDDDSTKISFDIEGSEITERCPNPLLCESTLEQQIYAYVSLNGKKGATAKVGSFIYEVLYCFPR
jgi:hypothetical protein